MVRVVDCESSSNFAHSFRTLVKQRYHSWFDPKVLRIIGKNLSCKSKKRRFDTVFRALVSPFPFETMTFLS